MYCEKCLKLFTECTCYKGKKRVLQFIDLVTKELRVMDDIVFHEGKYHFRILNLNIETKRVDIINKPLQVVLTTDSVTFTEQTVGYDYIHKGHKMKIIRIMELLDNNKTVIFKQLIDPLHVALEEDTVTFEWTLGM